MVMPSYRTHRTAPERLPLAAKDARSNLLRAFKATGCVECGRRYPELDWSDLHCHHIDPRDKSRSSNANSRVTANQLLAELLLCQVLCIDCHHKRHSRNGAAPLEGQLTLFNGNGGWRY